MQENRKRKIFDIILRVCAPLALILFIPAYHLLVGTSGLDNTYEIIVRTFLIIDCPLILVGVLLIMFGRARSRVLRWSVGLIVALTIICLLILAHGMWQDIRGIHCSDFMGKNSAPCSEMTSLWLFFLLLNPFSFVALASAILVSLGTGLWQEYRYRIKTKSQKHPRNPHKK